MEKSSSAEVIGTPPIGPLLDDNREEKSNSKSPEGDESSFGFSDGAAEDKKKCIGLDGALKKQPGGGLRPGLDGALTKGVEQAEPRSSLKRGVSGSTTTIVLYERSESRSIVTVACFSRKERER